MHFFVRLIASLCFVILFPLNGLADQEIDSWRTYPAFGNISRIAMANEQVFATSWGNLFCYDQAYQSFYLYTKENGLNDVSVKEIAYSDKHHLLLIAYNNSNLDLMESDGDKIYNISDLYNKPLNASKTINHIAIDRDRAYLSTDFGVMVINLSKKEVAETYMFNEKIYTTLVDGQTLYVLGTQGIYQAHLSDNLLDMNNWKLVHRKKNLTKLFLFNQHIYALTYGKQLEELQGDNSWKVVKSDLIRDCLVAENRLYFYTYNKLYSLDAQSKLTAVTLPFSFIQLTYTPSTHTFWGCEQERGLIGFKLNGNTFEQTHLPLLPDGPMIYTAPSLSFDHQRLIVAGGGRWGDRFHRKGAIMLYHPEQNHWHNYPTDSIQNNENKIEYKDIIQIAVNPNNPNHLFASSYGDGLYEFIDHKLVNLHRLGNSALESALPHAANRHQYVRVDALSYDAQGNLWMSNDLTDRSIKILTPDSSWISLAYDALTRQETITQIFHAQNGDKWITVPRGDKAGLFVLNTQKDLNEPSKHKTVFFSKFTDTEGKNISPRGVYCVAQDKNGVIWVGTDKGPLLFTNLSKVFDENYRCTRIKIPLENAEESEDGTILASYLLENEQINCIFIDGANRKWIGTENTGLYLLSEDGKQTIHHFTRENSPLPDNNIQSLSINPDNGELFIGTNQGIVSYMSDAIEGKESYSDIYAFPNPVKPDYEGPITIRGLKANSEVTITDIQGRVLYTARSLGGEITWDGRGNNRERVSSGVYLVMCATAEGKKGVVTKIVVIK